MVGYREKEGRRAKMSYKFKNEDTGFRTDKHVKFFFHRLDKDGKPSGSGQVSISWFISS